jgi:hypothetical protein
MKADREVGSWIMEEHSTRHYLRRPSLVAYSAAERNRVRREEVQ